MVFDRSIGIKQVIRYDWMVHTVDLIKSGLKNEEIKKEIEYYLSDRKGNGEVGDRAEYTMSLAVTLLMNIWVEPKQKLLGYRDRLLEIVKMKEFEPICHWAMISSVYPFWFNMFYIFGSLFKLQDQVKKSQIISRTYDLLGERNTIERCSRYVIRSFVSWDLIRDGKKAGIYEKGKVYQISDAYLASLLVEAMLYAVPETRIPLNSIVNCPAFCSFKFPVIDGYVLSKVNQNLLVEQYSVNEEMLMLKNEKMNH